MKRVASDSVLSIASNFAAIASGLVSVAVGQQEGYFNFTVSLGRGYLGAVDEDFDADDYR